MTNIINFNPSLNSRPRHENVKNIKIADSNGATKVNDINIIITVSKTFDFYRM